MTGYADAGVDIDAANRAVRLMAVDVASTSTEAVLSELGSFGGLYSLAGIAPDAVLAASTDGVGTKTELAARFGRWRGLGADIVNHCVNDIAVQGARPLFLLDYIACAELVPETVAEIVAGMAEACKSCGTALLGGETAEMPGVYTSGAVDVAATVVGVVEPAELLPRCDLMKPGDVLVGLAADSPHTNGYSLIRRLLDTLDPGDFDPEHARPDAAMIDWLLAPHRCYLSDIEALRAAGVSIKGLAHITGGGFFENIPRVLAEQLRAEIELGAWQVPAGFRRLVEWGEVPDDEAFRTWNMGIGMIAVVDAAEADAAVSLGHSRIGTLHSRAEPEAPQVQLAGDWR